MNSVAGDALETQEAICSVNQVHNFKGIVVFVELGKCLRSQRQLLAQHWVHVLGSAHQRTRILRSTVSVEDGPEQEVVAQRAAATINRCKSWRLRTHAWVRVGPMS